MENAANDTICIDRPQCAPIDLPEVHGLPWDQQVEAAHAWQAAGGNVDDADEAEPAPQGYLPTMRTITRMNTVLVSLRERLQQIQIEAANVAIVELSLREASTPETPNVEDAFSPLHPDQLQQFDALAASCLQLLTSAQTTLAAVPGFLPNSIRTVRRTLAAQA
ncbi:hypothetical protein [Azoarcus sp. KH32C]|uniref:hypothetical protein n=1 Tax=Azoarcus sp. KH32C TaxID=748247 RepID=UPI0002386201|nr:hypothetical protein [Azoarcus sp. KH32C]BAL22449.1 hypothetical protein AZKH_0102 [Azoarcus sp. KH32C]